MQNLSKKIYFPFAKFSLFVVYFWFGILKVTGESPASPLVLELLDKTLPFITPSLFLTLFGLFEVLIGILFLIPNKERFAVTLLFLHIITTVLPLFVLPHLSWNGLFVPTMEGQYILKNILIVALAFTVLANKKPRL